MSDRNPNTTLQDQSESADDFSFPFNLNKKSRDIFSQDEKGGFSKFFEYTNENEGSGSDFEEENQESKNEKSESSQYSLFRKPIDELVENSSSTKRLRLNASEMQFGSQSQQIMNNSDQKQSIIQPHSNQFHDHNMQNNDGIDDQNQKQQQYQHHLISAQKTRASEQDTLQDDQSTSQSNQFKSGGPYMKYRIGEIGKNKTQENQQNFLSLISENGADQFQLEQTRVDGSHKQNNRGDNTSMPEQTSTIDNSFQSPDFKQTRSEINSQVPSASYVKQSQKAQGLLKFKSHEADTGISSLRGQLNRNANHQLNQNLGEIETLGALADKINDKSSEAGSLVFQSSNNDPQEAFVSQQLRYFGNFSDSENSYPQSVNNQQNEKGRFGLISDSYDAAFANPSYYQSDVDQKPYDLKQQNESNKNKFQGTQLQGKLNVFGSSLTFQNPSSAIEEEKINFEESSLIKNSLFSPTSSQHSYQAMTPMTANFQGNKLQSSFQTKDLSSMQQNLIPVLLPNLQTQINDPKAFQNFDQSQSNRNQKCPSPSSFFKQSFMNEVNKDSGANNNSNSNTLNLFSGGSTPNYDHYESLSTLSLKDNKANQVVNSKLPYQLTANHQDFSSPSLLYDQMLQSQNQHMEDQQMQLISGFEGIELNNQQISFPHDQNSQLKLNQQLQSEEKLQNLQSQTLLTKANVSVNNQQPSNLLPNLRQDGPKTSQNIDQSSLGSQRTLQQIGLEEIKQGGSLIQSYSEATQQYPYAPQLTNPYLQSTLSSGIGSSHASNINSAFQPVISSPQIGHSQINLGHQNQPVISNNVLIDQNESILVKIMCNYEEASSQTQKLSSLKGNVINLAMNQTGSKFLQRLLDNANPQIVQFLLDEIHSHLPMVMVDNYGNYFCQELLINCSSTQRMQILERIAVDFIAICCNKKGTHTIQKFIELVNLEAEEKFFQRVLQGHVALLSADVQGTHVIQILIQSFPEEKRQFAFEEIYDKFISLATDYSGLSVIKIIIQKTKIPENRAKLMKTLVENAIELAQNPYGNYAIQKAFEYWDKEMCQEMIPKFFGKVYQLSLQKCSSNVIDKCIQNSKPEYLSILMQELISCERLSNLITNAYGNFVVQNALRFAPQEFKLQLSEQIEKNISSISDPKIKQKWVSLLKKKNLGDLKGAFKSQDSDTSETSSKSGKRPGAMSDYSGRSDNHSKSSKKFNPQSAQQNPNMFNTSQIRMPPPSNRAPSANYGQTFYTQPTPAYQQGFMMQPQSPQMMMAMYPGQPVQQFQRQYMPVMNQQMPLQHFYQMGNFNQQNQMALPEMMMNQNLQSASQMNPYSMVNPGFQMQQNQQQAIMNQQQQINPMAAQMIMPNQIPQQNIIQQNSQYDPLAVQTEQSILGKRPSPLRNFPNVQYQWNQHPMPQAMNSQYSLQQMNPILDATQQQAKNTSTYSQQQIVQNQNLLIQMQLQQQQLAQNSQQQQFMNASAQSQGQTQQHNRNFKQ